MKKLIYILLPLFIFSACKKDKNGIEGSLEGNVSLIDISGQTYIGQENVRVTAKEDLLNKGVSSSATTNRYGYYKMDELWSGRYSVTFSREGFGSQSKSVSLIGGDVPQQLNTTLYEIPENVFTSFSLNVNQYNTLVYEFTGAHSLQGNYKLQLYVSLSSSPDFDPLKSETRLHGEFNISMGIIYLTSYSLLTLDDIRDRYFPGGGKIYAVACLGNGYESIYSPTALRLISDVLEIDLP